MFITRKHLSRRTVLRGMGATVALPFLEAMVPARTALAKTAAGKDPPRGHRDGARLGRRDRASGCRRTCGRRRRWAAVSI